ncbi:hypothetical protein [Fusobacterium sp. MFO224]|uniref:hypothetical protein n=1 Tax=Fusobacterium sp. MFO224 TaxID=3378070 RepID=UPI00385260D1
MVTTVALILIFITNSISLRVTSCSLVMPYLLYLSSYKKVNNLYLIGILTVVYSLQTDKIFINIFIFLGCYLVFLLVQKNIKYQYLNIPIFSLIQVFLWHIIFLRKFNEVFIINLVLCSIFNYIYLKIYKKEMAGAIK